MRQPSNRYNCLPVRRPLLEGLLTPDELSQLSPEMREQKFSEWEQYREELITVNKQNFETALVRIKLCAYLNGFLSAFAGTPADTNKHYSWCVYHEWFSEKTTDI